MTHNLPRSSAVVILVPKRIHRIENPKQESTIHTTPEHSFDLLVFFRCHINTRFGISIDIRGVDYPSREQRLRVIHQLPTIQYKSCVCIKIGLNEITLVSSVISISSSAGRWEREVWDMFGIRFSNYPELRRILTDYGFESHPLRKDFPLSGYVEVRYDDLEKCVISERLEMAQEFRYSDLTSPWKLTLSRHLSTKRYSFLFGRWRSRCAMNPVDYPYGGGEGRMKGGRPSVSPWGKPTKCLKLELAQYRVKQGTSDSERLFRLYVAIGSIGFLLAYLLFSLPILPIIMGVLRVILSLFKGPTLALCAGGSLPSEVLKMEIDGFSNAKGWALVERLTRDQPTEMQRLGLINSQDVRNGLREDWQGVHNLANGGGQLPTADDIHELVQSLDNEAVSFALSVLKKKLGLYPWQQGEIPAVPLGPHAIREIKLIFREITMAAIGCTEDVASLVGDLTEVATLLQLPSPNNAEAGYLAGKAHFYLDRFLEETKTELPTFFTRHYGGKFREKCLLLAYLYGRLFHFLPRDPELLFPENEGISDREREARIELIQEVVERRAGRLDEREVSPESSDA